MSKASMNQIQYRCIKPLRTDELLFTNSLRNIPSLIFSAGRGRIDFNRRAMLCILWKQQTTSLVHIVINSAA